MPSGSNPAKEGHIFLVGFMGCGKTTVGRCLAARLDRPFVDLDDTVERHAGRSIAEIFRQQGEEGFRRRESEALEAVMDGPSSVVATGGGILTVESNRERMAAAGVTVWLDTPFAIILQRLGEEGRRQRPLFASEVGARQLYEQRLPAYRRAELNVEIGEGDAPETVAAIIAERIRGEHCVT